MPICLTSLPPNCKFKAQAQKNAKHLVMSSCTLLYLINQREYEHVYCLSFWRVSTTVSEATAI